MRVISSSDGSALAFAVGERARAVRPGLRNRMFAAARGMTGVVALGRGDPDFATPPHVVRAAQRALDDGYTHYTPWTGLPELRRAIANKLSRENQLVVDPDSEVLVTTGGQQALFVAMQALLDAGDEVLIPDPHYASYDAAIRLAGGVVVPVPTAENDNFEIRPEVLLRYVTPRTKALVIVNPNNPSGNVLRREALARLGELARERNLVVISDEIYEKFVYDGTPLASIATLPGMRERTVTINSFSKTYAMTGWRLGYMAAPADFLESVAEINYAISICAPAATQVAGVAAIEGPQGHIEAMVREYGERRRFMLSALDKMGLTYGDPQGGFTVFVNVKPTGIGSVEFCLRLLSEARVQIFPGLMYGPAGEGYARISFLAPLATLREGMARIAGFVAQLGTMR